MKKWLLLILLLAFADHAFAAQAGIVPVQVFNSSGAAVDDFGGAGGGTADDADFTAGTTTGTPAMGAYQSSPTNCTDGDACIVGITQTRQLRTSVEAVVPGTGATNLGKAVGNAAGATDTGIVPLAIRDDALSALSDAEGDYVPVRVDANGALWINLATALNSSVDSITTAGNTGANGNAKINCTARAHLNMTTATTTEIVALSGSTHIYICGYVLMLGGSTATNVKFVSGTGSNCATSQADISANFPLDPSTRPGVSHGGGEGMVLKTDAGGDAICVTSSAAGNPLAIQINYTQF